MKKLDIIYEDKEIIVINKPNGILTINDNKNSTNLYHEVREYVKKKNYKNKIFIVHRLDKDTSGLIVFAKSEKSKIFLQNNWNNFTREYIAVVEGVPKLKKDRLVNYLQENKFLRVFVSNKGDLAITNYEVIKNNSKYSLLKINIETGRKNQIRAQLNYIGNTIVGDKKYGSKVSKRLMLHASRLVIVHPITKNKMTFEIDYPKEFDKIIGK